MQTSNIVYDNSHSPCPQIELCGSCGWSHIPYTKQLKQKISDINGSFKLHEVDLTVTDIIPSTKTSHYRNKMDFVIDFEGRLGMRQKGKWWKVIDNHKCFLADKQIENAFDHIYKWLKTSDLTYFDRKSHIGFLRYAVIRATSINEIMINIVTSRPTGKEQEKLVELAESLKPTSFIWSINNTITDVSFGDETLTLYGKDSIEEEVNGIKYEISPNAFFQTNSETASILQNKVIEFAGDVTNKNILDLYCGTGFFALALKKAGAKKVTGIEIIDSAIKDAQKNAEINKLDIDFETAKTEEYDWSKFNADLVILDPPRSGMHDSALADIIKNKPKEIIYISCNYKNFAREMKQLQALYNVGSMIAIDMFPHTPHVELVSKLTLK
jgi:23S rRNA (uracil-5-)-methyltransferase RumA